MAHLNVLYACDVTDETGKIRPEFPRKLGSDWVPHGTYVVLRDDGTKSLEITYRHGIPHGPYSDYWSNGALACKGQFSEGMQESVWYFYDQDGNTMDVLLFNAGLEIPAFGNG